MNQTNTNTDNRSLLKNALLELKKMHAELNALEKGITEPIAIVGMGCRFPGGANNPQAYWDLLHNGVNAITEIPSDRWDVDAYYDPDPDTPGKMYTRYGAFLKNVAAFDPQFFEISPREAHSMDPQQRLLLEVTWSALEHAGVAADSLKGTQTGVFMGVCFDDYAKFNVKSADTSRIAAYDALGNFRSVAAGRIAYFLGLQGPTMQLDTTCSSALLGIHLACQSLRTKESNLALAGGVNLMLEPGTTVGFCKLKALAADGKCKTFDAAANGYVRGEGCGIVVLKRLSDALADGDRIQAVIRGSAVNHDGRSNGLTAPNGSAQEALLRQALDHAKVKPQQIQYVEAHGTGTSLGDPIEVSALGRVLGQGRSQDNPLAIGSVKTNFGHLETAAGIAGVMKVVLALQNQEIPPHLHLQEPNPYIPWQKYPLVVPTEPTPWVAQAGTRLAGVSSFGMSGTNVHVILEQAPEPAVVEANNLIERPYHLLALSAKNEAALQQMSRNYLEFLESDTGVSLADICFTANTGRSHFVQRLSIVSESKAQLQKQLQAFSQGQVPSGVAQGNSTNHQRQKIAFLFTGQGSQFVGMGSQLFETQPVFRETLIQCDALLRPYLDKPLLSILYPEPNQTSPLNQTAYTQPCLFAFEYALAKLWQAWGIQPDVVMGHSLGEYVAACIAGVFSLEDALKLIVHRARLMQALPANGEMVAVFADEVLVRDCLSSSEVVIAGFNSPENTVISGHHRAIAEVVTTLKAQGIETKKLNVSHAFHSSLMQPMLAEFREVAAQVNYSAPQLEIISNLTGEVATNDIATPDYWCRHIRLPVKFSASLATLKQKGYQVFLEIGAKPTLIGMGRQCLTGRENLWLPSLRWGQSDWQQMLTSLGAIYTQGFTVDWSGFDSNYPRRKVVLPSYPFQQQRYWVEPVSAAPQSLLPSNSHLHPLLGEQLRLPFSQEIRFESQFSPSFPTFMQDHQLFGITVVPGAAYVATALAAAKEALGAKSCVVEDLFFPQALVLSPDCQQTVQVLLAKTEEQVYSCQIISLKAGQNENEIDAWKLHSTSQIKLAETEVVSTTPQAIDIATLTEQYPQSLSKAEFYQPIWDFGYTLGSLFQWNQTVWRQDGEAWCKLESPAALLDQELNKYQLYPGLIDSCLQLLVNLLQTDAEVASKNKEIYLPFIIEKFKFYRRPEANEQLWCHAQSRDNANGSREKLSGDLRLVTQTGELIAEIEGFELRKASQQLLQQELQPTEANLLYEITWQPQERQLVDLVIDSEAAGNWLIFADRGGIGQQIAQRLADYNLNCTLVFANQAGDSTDERTYIIDPTNPQDFQQLFQQQQFQGILHLWSLDSSLSQTTTLKQIQTAQELGCASVLHLLQALLDQDDNAQLPRLHLVTQGAMSVGNSNNLNASQTPLWGLGKVIALEHPDLERRLIDLDPDRAAESIPALITEMLSPEPEDQIAWRQGLRYVARLTNSTKSTMSNQPQIDSNGSYLIAGGLGALGLKVANWLVEQGARSLVLTGRGDASVKAQKAIALLEEAGVEVLVVKADISDYAQVAEIFPVIASQMSPLRGVIQAAGVLDDGMLLRQEWSRFKGVMGAKVAGSWNLHRLTAEIPLDFFICFSSVASLIGSPGQGNYAAANAFMDGLCHYRRSLGLPATSINWGPWAEAGMAANAPEQWQQLLAGWGFQSLAVEQGLTALGQVLQHQPAQLGVVSIDWSKFISQFSPGSESSLLAEMVKLIQPTTTLKSAPKAGLLEKLAQTPSSQREKQLLIYLQEQLAEVLKLDPSQQLNPQQGFFEMGIDSLMTIELKNKVEDDLGCSLPSTLLFKYPTLASLAPYLLTKLVESDLPVVVETQPQINVAEIELTNTVSDVEQLSEAEAEALLLAKLETF